MEYGRVGNHRVEVRIRHANSMLYVSLSLALGSQCERNFGFNVGICLIRMGKAYREALYPNIFV